MSSLLRTYRRAYKRRKNDWMAQMRKSSLTTSHGRNRAGLRAANQQNLVPRSLPSPLNPAIQRASQRGG